jgi:hypothetical protein
MSDEFEKRTRALLEESAAKLDGRTLSRLTQARHAALSRREDLRPWWRTWVPVGAAAAATVLGVMVWTGPGMDRGTQIAGSGGTTAFEDIDLLVDAPEFVADVDDMEFYEWAAGEIDS